MKIILASKSPRRKALLEDIGLDFSVLVSDADENYIGKSPEDTVSIIAERKGRAVLNRLEESGCDISDTLIISCDTLVCIDDMYLGKPSDRADVCRMINLLSGRAHNVVSGLCLIYNGKIVSECMSTQVIFSKLTQKQIERYADCDEPYDKAGAYAIQGKGSAFVESICGDYFNVVGLPINLLCRMADKYFGINLV